jgi:hypothetical protein
MGQRERLVGKVAKLLALGSSPVSHEAASARRMAEALMKTHGIRADEVSSWEGSGYYEKSMGSRGWNVAWRLSLVTAAARYHGAEAVSLLKGRRRTVRIAGERRDVEAAAELYEILLGAVLDVGREVRRIPLAGILLEELDDYGERDCADAFRRGEVSAVVRMLVRKRREQEEAPRASSGEGSETPAEAVPTEVAREAPRSLRREQEEAPRALSGEGSETPAEAVPTEVAREAPRSLVRVGRSLVGKTARARTRYSPEERPVTLDDVFAVGWFELGYQLAKRRIAVNDNKENGGEP